MVSMCIEDYEVAGILGANVSSTCFKVKNKETKEFFAWKALSYAQSSKEELIGCIDQIRNINNLNVLSVHGYIPQQELKILYVITDFCENGNLCDAIKKCVHNHTYLSETFLWRTFYQITSALRALSSFDCAGLDLSDILLDLKYNVKLCMIRLPSNCNAIVDLLPSFRNVLYQLCMLHLHCTDFSFQNLPTHYTDSLKDLIRFLYEHECLTLKSALDTILYHPNSLIKYTDILPNMIFIKNTQPTHNCATTENASKERIELNQSCLKTLKDREYALKLREQKVSAREQELKKRERKIALMERIVKEKTSRAEVYLKRSRESKGLKMKVSYEDINTSLSADCGDLSILPTIAKPTRTLGFTRSMSERRVQFKGHSPLKDMCNVNPSSGKIATQAQRASILDIKGIVSSRRGSTTDGLSETYSDDCCKKTVKRRSQLFSFFTSSKSNCNSDKNIADKELVEHCRPISWTTESKQHAFDLLRIMNADNKENIDVSVKHTYL